MFPAPRRASSWREGCGIARVGRADDMILYESMKLRGPR